MHELTAEEKEAILLLQIKQAREILYGAQNLNEDEETINHLQSKVDTLEANYLEQFGE
jgi:hypothetical protein